MCLLIVHEKRCNCGDRYFLSTGKWHTKIPENHTVNRPRCIVRNKVQIEKRVEYGTCNNCAPRIAPKPATDIQHFGAYYQPAETYMSSNFAPEVMGNTKEKMSPPRQLSLPPAFQDRSRAPTPGVPGAVYDEYGNPLPSAMVREAGHQTVEEKKERFIKGQRMMFEGITDDQIEYHWNKWAKGTSIYNWASEMQSGEVKGLEVYRVFD